MAYLLELNIWVLLVLGTVVLFDLEVDFAKKAVLSKTGSFLLLGACGIEAHSVCSFILFAKRLR